MYDPSGNMMAVSTNSFGASVTTQPAPQLFESNAPVAISVVANGAGLSYQWLSNGVVIAGATSDTLLLPNLTGTNFANYSVIISNVSGVVTSSVAAIWLDSKGTGMPDWWQMKYFGNLNQLPGEDYDTDTVANLNEFLEGTDPTNPASYNPRLHVNGSGGWVTSVPDLAYYTNGQSVTLTAVPDAGNSFFGWAGAITTNSNPVSLVMKSNITLTASFGVPLPVALDNPNLVWTTGGDALWFGQRNVSHDGMSAAQSGLIINNQTSWLQATTNLAQTTQLSFWWQVSSQPPDELTFSVDGNVFAGIWGETPAWQNFQIVLPAGNHTLRWTYLKDPSDNLTDIPFWDSAWVDQVTLSTTLTASNSIVTGDVLAIDSVSGSLYRYRPTDGSFRILSNVGSLTQGMAVDWPFNNNVWICSQGSRISRVALNTGLSSTFASGLSYFDVAYLNGQVYATDRSGTVHVYDAAGGSLITNYTHNVAGGYSGIALDPVRQQFVLADNASGLTDNRLDAMTTNGVFTTLAQGNGSPGSNQIYTPYFVKYEAPGQYLIGYDSANNSRIQRVTVGTTTNVAMVAEALNTPLTGAADGHGIIYLGNYGAGTLRQMNSDGSGLTTLSGLNSPSGGHLYNVVVVGGGQIPPIIISQPQSQIVADGSNVTFVASATGSQPLSYQWSFDNTLVPGATNPSLTLLNVALTNAGNYQLTVTNAYGATNSAVATLAVDVPPQITSQPTDQTVTVGSNATFGVSATGTPPFAYQWVLNSTNMLAMTNAVLTITNAQPSNVGYYQVIVANSYGAVTSTVAALTISTPIFLNPIADARIQSFSSTPDGTSIYLSIYNDSVNIQRTLVRFDLSTISTNKFPSNAILKLYADANLYSSGNPSGLPMEVYRVTNSWVESLVTWSQRTSTVSWAAAGGDYVGTTGVSNTNPYAVNSTTVTNRYFAQSPLELDWNVTGLVQEWYSGTHSNYGLLILSYSGNYLTFHSRESGTSIPVLEIDTLTVPITPPVAMFTAFPTNGVAPMAVNFTDNSTGIIANRFWDFGDGKTTNTTATSLSHTYTAGNYTVILVVSGPNGASTNIQPNAISALTPFAAWQLQYFNCTNCPQAASGADPLGKGMSNTNQFLAGLNPTNSASVFRIISVVRQSNNMAIAWATAGVRTNAVQATAGGANSGYSNNFIDISGPIIIPSSGDTATNYLDAGGATNTSLRFYRVRLVP